MQLALMWGDLEIKLFVALRRADFSITIMSNELAGRQTGLRTEYPHLRGRRPADPAFREDAGRGKRESLSHKRGRKRKDKPSK